MPEEKMRMNQRVTIAACQLFDIQDNLDQSLAKIMEYASRAADQGAQLICFPECYLQGYILEEHEARRRAIDVSSDLFINILKRLKNIQPLLVIGMIEQESDKLYITAIVVKQGELLGCYRKNRLAPWESMFEPGENVPIFEVEGLRFGINICYDLNWSECAAAIAHQSTQLMVCPCYNMLSYENAEKWKFKHNAIRAERTVETGLWLLSADVTGERDGQISYGPTALINPHGTIVAQVPLLEEGMIVQEITL